jgi:hypothetical protein
VLFLISVANLYPKERERESLGGTYIQERCKLVTKVYDRREI